MDVPVRACDVGGWTDTWFAGHGRVCSLAVGPGVSVRAVAEGGRSRLWFDLVDYGVEFSLGAEPLEHRLLGEAAREAGDLGGLDVTLRIEAAVPPGCALGTSAAVAVGVVAALDAVRDQQRPPDGLAAAAHRAEAGRLGRESGVQDQVASAHGGANLIEVAQYPLPSVHPISLPDETRRSLDDRLLHVAYGEPHDSSAVHEEVIAGLTADGPAASVLETLRALAADAASCLRRGDLERYGTVLTAATDAQRTLHPALLSGDAATLIDLATEHRAAGWKLNGAGGQGGSLSILCGDPADRPALLEAARQLGHRPLSLRLALGGPRVTRGVSDR